MENANDPITVIVTRVVRAGCESAFEGAVKDFIPTALAFPGHLGVHMLRPSPNERDYGAVLKFRSQSDWDAFRESAEYSKFLAKIEPYLDQPQGVETLCGLESWFTPLAARAPHLPPRWKMASVTWIGVCMMVYLINVVLSWVAPDIPTWLRFFVTNALVVAGLTWAVMPILSRLFRPWLLPALTPTEAQDERRRGNSP